MSTFTTIENLFQRISREPESLSQGVDPAKSAERTLIHLGAVAYLNTKPLIYGLESRLGECGKLTLELPSRLATQLQNADIDVGLIPVVEYFHRIDQYRVVSNAVIACRGPVWSVRVFFRCEPAKVRTLALDEGSRTSVALAKVLFHSRFGFVPETEALPMTVDPRESNADAVLVIGDRAMHPERYHPVFAHDWDLGQVWFEETGLPFVFAMWVARDQKFASIELGRMLEAARDAGREHVAEIAAATSHRYDLTPEQCITYLSQFLHFQMDDEHRRGLDEFHRRCRALSIVAANRSAE